jgi:hypothetical protein
VTGCGCLLLIAALVGLIVFLIFGSTDPGEPIESAVALLFLLWSGQGHAVVPHRRVLVRAGDA